MARAVPARLPAPLVVHVAAAATDVRLVAFMVTPNLASECN
jgi:hypothetical protein